MTLEDCKTCEKHSYHGNGFVICHYWNMNEQRITRTGEANIVHIISCPKESDIEVDQKKEFRPRWNKSLY
ncbi:MAG: hypothetical protein EPN93_14315 [Spirochaetes bacterium]|nr:MAG: hypothetical protein EPN93_14315 [Spirochaetota bacterium]